MKNNILQFAVVFLFIFTHNAFSLNYLPLSKVRTGMIGYGKTVFKGYTVSKFGIKIVSIVPQGGPTGESLILIKVYGKEIESVGGISLGMSGSPIYINNKLVGAISTTFPDTDHLLGGVTPIESMLKFLSKEKLPEKVKTSIRLKQPIEIHNRKYYSLRYTAELANGEWRKIIKSPSDELVAVPVFVPVMINGLNGRISQNLKTLFSNNNLPLYPGGNFASNMSKSSLSGYSNINHKTSLQPGSSISVQLVRGDMDVSAVGTLTAIDKGRIIAFGHPIFRKGVVNFILADAYVHGIVNGDTIPFKIASSSHIRGSVIEDRGNTIIGKLGIFPKLVPVYIKVKDKTSKREIKLNVKIVKDFNLLPDLLASVIVQTVDTAVDRIGKGTAKLAYSIAWQGFNKPITRTNMFYNDYDIASTTVGELVSTLTMLTENKFREVDITSIIVNIDVDDNSSLAFIEGVSVVPPELKKIPKMKTFLDLQKMQELLNRWLFSTYTAKFKMEQIPPRFDNEQKSLEDENNNDSTFLSDIPDVENNKSNKFPEIYAGEDVELKITLRPYRSKPYKESLLVKVPADVDEGSAIIDIYSGSKSQPIPLMITSSVEMDIETSNEREKETSSPFESTDEQHESFEDMVEELISRDKNNELIAKISPINFKSNYGEIDNDISESNDINVEDALASNNKAVSNNKDSKYSEGESINLQTEIDSIKETKSKKNNEKGKSKKELSYIINGSKIIKVKIINPMSLYRQKRNESLQNIIPKENKIK